MGRWMRIGAALAVAALLVGTAVGCGPTVDDKDKTGGGEASGEPIRIGAVLSLTGAQSGLGAPEKNALEMDVERINEAGGINGRPIKLFIEDDASDVDQAVSATTKLIERDGVVAIIGSTGSGQSMAMRGSIVKAQVPQVSLGSSTEITDTFDEWVFQTPWTANLIVPLTLDYLKGEGFKTIGVITEDTSFGKDGKRLMNEKAADYGLTVVGDEVFKPTDTDMTAQLTVLKNANPDAIVMYSSVAASAMVPKNMTNLAMEMPVVGSHGIARQEFIDGAGADGEGVTAFAGKILAPTSYGKDSEQYEVASGFVERYTEAYGKAPDHFAGHAYDGLYLIVEAAKRLPADFTPADLRDEIEKTEGFPGIGGSFTYSATDHNGMTKDDIVRYVIEDGKWVLAE